MKSTRPSRRRPYSEAIGSLTFRRRSAVSQIVVDGRDGRADPCVVVVRERAPGSGARLDQDLVAALAELARAGGRQGDAVLVRLDLLDDADPHGARTIPRKTGSVQAKRPLGGVAQQEQEAREGLCVLDLLEPSRHRRRAASGRSRSPRRRSVTPRRSRGRRHGRGGSARGRSRASSTPPASESSSRRGGRSPRGARASPSRAAPLPRRPCRPGARAATCAPPHGTGGRE